MEKGYAIVKDNIVQNIIVIDDNHLAQFPDAIYIGGLPIMQGMTYSNGHFVNDERKIACFVLPVELTESKQIRQYCYQNLRLKGDTSPLINWESENLTVDEAIAKHTAYFVEASEHANHLQVLIISAKEYIRGIYPE